MARRATGLTEIGKEYYDWDRVLARGEEYLRSGDSLEALKTTNIALRLASSLPQFGKTAGMTKAALAWSFAAAAKMMIANRRHKEAVDAAKYALSKLEGAYYRLPRTLGRAATMSAIYQCLHAVGLGGSEPALVALEGLKSDLRAGIKKDSPAWLARILEISQDMVASIQRQGDRGNAREFCQWLANRVGGKDEAATLVEKMIYQLDISIDYMPEAGRPRDLSEEDIEALEMAAHGALRSFKKSVKKMD
jgi:hypothetical protein